MMRRRAFGLILGALVLGGAGLAASLPQVRVLLVEGFPAPTWPAAGRFAEVKGAAVPAPLPQAPRLPEAAQRLFDDSGGRAMLVEQGGTLRHAAFGAGHGPEDRFNSYSMVKSLVGLLVLKAQAEGRLPGPQTRLPALLGAEAPDVTLQELLDMTGGLTATAEPVKSDGDEGYSPFSALGKTHVYGPEAALGALWIDAQRRGRFHYQSVNTALLGRVLEQAHGTGLSEILSAQIWQPAGAASAQWRSYPAGEGVSAYCCLYATAQDWLRVGRFVLSNGAPEAPFLPEATWRAAVLPELPPDTRRAGAYRGHMRHDVLDRPGAAVRGGFAYAMGHGGQVMYLVPDADAVVVRFGARPQLLHSTLYTTLGAAAGR